MIEKAGPYFASSTQTLVLEPARCPVCKQPDRIEKVSSIVRQTSGQVVLPRSRRASDFTTDLSESLRMPARYHAVSLVLTIGAIALSLAILGAILGLVELLLWQDLFEAPQRVLSMMKLTAVPWFGVLIPAIAAWRYLRDRHVARQTRPEWEWGRKRWDRMYYCFRDDIVFLPYEAITVPPERMIELLRRPPSPTVAANPAPAPIEATP